jgi:hypothetical protein
MIWAKRSGRWGGDGGDGERYAWNIPHTITIVATQPATTGQDFGQLIDTTTLAMDRMVILPCENGR